MKSEHESFIESLKRRAYFLRKFFKGLNMEISLLGDYNSPLVVTNENIVLSCYLHNFQLIFKDAPHNGNEVFRLKLKNSLKADDYREQFEEWFKASEHRKVFLFQSGDFYFNKSVQFLDTDYPLYTKCKRLAYYVFSMEKALEVQKKISEFDKKVRIIL